MMNDKVNEYMIDIDITPEMVEELNYRITTAEDGDIIEKEIETHIVNKYIGNFYGLLVNELKMKKSLVPLIMFLNDLPDGGSFNGNMKTIKMPSVNFIEKLNITI